MQEKVLERVEKDAAYLLAKLSSLEDLPVTEKVVVELLCISHVLKENKKHIDWNEYQKIEIDEKKVRKEVKKTDEYKKLMKKKQIKDLEIAQSTKPEICLISQKEITDKVEAPCGHAFNREALLFLYSNTKNRKNFFCPHMGCSKNWNTLKFKPPKKK